MKNKQIAEILNRMGTLLEIKGELIFKIRAYYKAAQNIELLGEDIEKLKAENRLSQIAGIGKTLEEKIVEFLDTGKMTVYEQLIKEIPESVLEIVEIPSIGPKKAKLFYDQLQIKSLADLKKALQEGRLTGLPGIKEKTIENIKQGIRIVQEGQERMNLGLATRVAEEFIGALKNLPEVRQISAAGSLRRMRETIRDIDILVDSLNPQRVMETLVHLPQVKKINVQGDTKSSVITQENVQVDLRVVKPESFGAALLYFTGSKNFNVKLRQVAIKKDMKVNEYGIFSLKGKTEKCLASRTEEECFRALGLEFVPPELREDIGEAELFSGHQIPSLIELKDIQGDLHVHSTWSDGFHTIAEMVEAAQGRGYRYLAVSDHSPRLRIAGGVSPENLIKKKKEIDQINKEIKNFRVLFGTEVEIDSEGNLDYSDKVLSEFDIVIASIHSGFEQSSAQIMKRLIKVCQNKYAHIIAHPTGVHLGKREPYDVDLKELCRVAGDTNTAMEINGFPIRLDLNSANVYFARQQGARFVVSSDSHRKEHLEYIRFGVALARRGWLTKGQVLNTMSLENLLKAIKK